MNELGRKQTKLRTCLVRRTVVLLTHTPRVAIYFPAFVPLTHELVFYITRPCVNLRVRICVAINHMCVCLTFLVFFNNNEGIQGTVHTHTRTDSP